MSRVDRCTGEGQAEGAPEAGAAARAAFGETANPAAYVPRAASEAALGALQAGLGAGRLAVALTGPPGIGKSTLLRVLEVRIRAHAGVVHLPYAALPLEELAAWSLGLMREPALADPVGALARAAARSAAASGPLHLLVDDANSMPLETARQLGDLLARCAGELRLAMAAPTDARTSRVVAALGPGALEVAYATPLDAAEARVYVDARLRFAAAPTEVRERLDEETVCRLHGVAGGNPRRLHLLAAEVARGEAGRPVLARLESEWRDLLVADDALAGDLPSREEGAWLDAPESPAAQARRNAPGPSRASRRRRSRRLRRAAAGVDRRRRSG